MISTLCINSKNQFLKHTKLQDYLIVKVNAGYREMAPMNERKTMAPEFIAKTYHSSQELRLSIMKSRLKN
jgi:hypothetical protein